MYYKIQAVYENLGKDLTRYFDVKIHDITKEDVERLRVLIEKIHDEHIEQERLEEEQWQGEADQRRKAYYGVTE